MQGISHYSPSIPREEDRYYQELTARNRHFVSPATQSALKKLKILIAGCGSTGGACIEPLARAGVQNFALADSGTYELNNLNRQHAFTRNINQNKAEFHAEQLREINPFTQIQVHPEGITLENTGSLARWADVIMDAVDVTTPSGIAMKLALHEAAKRESKPVFTALDIGFCQWGRSYDYRLPSVEILGGALKQAKEAKHPLKALFSIVPLSAVPSHSLHLVADLLKRSEIPASQLGCTSDLLSAIIVPAIIRFVETGELVKGWNFNTEGLAMPLKRRARYWIKGVALRREIRALLKSIP